jgi:hypothetical protein
MTDERPDVTRHTQIAVLAARAKRNWCELSHRHGRDPEALWAIDQLAAMAAERGSPPFDEVAGPDALTFHLIGARFACSSCGAYVPVTTRNGFLLCPHQHIVAAFLPVEAVVKLGERAGEAGSTETP